MSEMKEFFLKCSCHDPRCLVWFWVDEGEDFTLFGIDLNSGDATLWRRIKNALFYIFAQKRFWYYGDICLTMDDETRGEVNKLAEFLKSAAKKE